MAESKEDIISNLRAIIISSKGGLKLSNVRGDYKETFGVDIPLKSLGCDSIEEFFKGNSENFTVIGQRVQAVTKASSVHIASLVSKQKTSKKGGRSKLSSKEARHIRKPVKKLSDPFPNIHSKKFNYNTPLRPLKQNSKESLTSSLKQLQQQQVAVSKKNSDDGSLKAVQKQGEREGKNDKIRDVPNQMKNTDLREIVRTVKNDLLSAKEKNNGNPKEIPVPFDNFQDFCFRETPQSKPKIKLSESTDLNLSPASSPFRRSLANNSQQDILSAKRTAKAQLIDRKVNPNQGKSFGSETLNDLDEGNKYEQKLKQFCIDKGLMMPNYSVIIRETAGNRTKCYGCKLTIGDTFNASTYPVETHSEISARELASKKAYTQLTLNNNLTSGLFRDSENVIRLRKLCCKKNLTEPAFKSIECHPKNEPRYFICKVRIGEDILLSSYPVEAADEFTARDLAAKKAYDHLNSESKTRMGASKDGNATLAQIYEIIKSKEYGVWCKKLPDLFLETHKEELPSNWFDLAAKSTKFEITKIDKVGHIIRVKNSSESNSVVGEEGEDEPSTKSLSLATLKVPESNQWEVYVTNVVNSAEIWCRLIGKDYSDVYDSMMIKLELNPPTSNVKSVTVGDIYLVNLEESWNRVKVIDAAPETETVSVFLIDIGVDEVVKKSQLFYLQKQFFTVAPQAILLSLNELDCLAECEELQLALFHSLLGNTFIAEIVAILDEGGNVSSVNLWDTSTAEDVNVNLKLLDDVIKTIKSPTLPPIGIVKEMFVSHVDDNGDVYLQASKQNATFVEWIISTKMKYSASLASVNNKKIDPKKLYATRSAKTGLFYRAKLIRNLDSNVVLVKYIDYGCEQEAAIDDLLDLEQTSLELALIPSQVTVAKFASNNALNNKTLALIRNQILEQSVLVKVTEIPLGSRPMVELLKRSQTDGTLSSINNKVFSEEQKTQTAESPTRKKSYVVGLENTLSRNLPMPNIPPVGSYFNVFVTLAAHPGLFNVQPLSTQNELMELMFRLQEKCDKFFSKPLSPEEFKIGELYAVKHSDNFWYRAYAQAFAGSSSFIVCLCDFGDFVEASPDKLMPLSGEFKTFPYQAIRAYLAGVAPANKDWPALDCVHFRELIVEKQFVSQIIEINRDARNPNYISLGLLLVDTSSSEDVYIHKLLVDKKMAVLKSPADS